MKKRSALFTALALATLLTGCRDPLGPEYDALAAARALWEASGPSSYRYDYQDVCFCMRVYIRVTVTGGAVTGVESLSDEPLPAANPPGASTVEELFARIAAGLDRNPHRAHIEYDPVLGYPRTARFDPEANVIDEEWGFDVEGFQKTLD